uniref:thiol:disulfide interchange protein n=1 Tax=Hypnea pseudomusciformis TaxID=1545697 RepID=UPI0027DA08F2|nr:thiol:disulfide interchange protein [Hypnea pseudomusciformis]WCH55039.1 thiol:disulfide interchange protein [Hypnea pseudomusciformis]WCH56632.1 thiol:disulfide interchange protein [Hypnea pseudomusciformis]
MSSFINFLEMKSYYLQQLLYILFYSRLNYSYSYSCILSLIGGILTCFNPCLLSILPISLSSIQNIQTPKNQTALMYGLIISNIIIITIITIFTQSYNKITIYIPILSSILTIFIGLNLLQLLKLNFYFLNKYLTINKNKNYWLTTLITGFTIGINSSTCSTPILTTITIWLNHSSNILSGISYILFYLIGYTMPVFFS